MRAARSQSAGEALWRRWWRRARTFPHGVHPDDHKALTCGLATQPLPVPPHVVLPLAQHIGKPSRPVV